MMSTPPNKYGIIPSKVTTKNFLTITKTPNAM